MTTLRTRVNRQLRRVTGYELRRSSTPETAPARKPAAALPADYDKAATRTIRAVRPYTMTSHEKLNALILAVRYVVDNAMDPPH